MSALVVAVLLPGLAGICLALARAVVSARGAAAAGAAVSVLSLICVVASWSARDGAYAGEVDHPWSTALGLHWHLGVDGISLPLVVMTILLCVLVCWSLAADVTSTTDAHEGAGVVLVALVLVIETASLGVFSALDLVLFFIFFELALIPMWFVIARWGDPGGGRLAATKFLMFTVTGSALMLVGFVVIAVTAGTLQIPTLADLPDPLTGTVPLLGGVAIAVGLAVKTPLWPLHIWLPDAHSKAPTVGSVLLAGVFLKLGTYGLLRVFVSVVPEPAARLAPYLGALAVAGIIASCLACLREHDLKRLIAYSSVGHMGFVVLAISTMSEVGVLAAVFASVAHGLITGLLFFNAGWLKQRYGSATFDVLGRGLYTRVPRLAVVLLFAATASLGLPGLAGFWGEMLALRSTYEPSPALDRTLAWTLLTLAALGVVLTTAYFVRVVRRVLQGAATPRDDDIDLTRTEAGISAVLAVAIVLLGVAPGLLTGVIEPAVGAIVQVAP